MRTNEDRAAAGRQAMDAYSEEIGYDEERDDPEALVDLLTELMHAYGHRAVKHCSRIALEHYQFETTYEEEE